MNEMHTSDKSIYQVLSSIVKEWKDKGKILPSCYENFNGENAILSEGINEDGLHFFQTKTMQRNNWIRVNVYYEDGSVEETYEK